jgi:hypothetical protein
MTYTYPPLPLPVGGSTETSSPTRPAEREEVEDLDESAEWQIKEGNEPPPAWSKRKAEEEEDGPSKRARIGFVRSLLSPRFYPDKEIKERYLMLRSWLAWLWRTPRRC